MSLVISAMSVPKQKVVRRLTWYALDLYEWAQRHSKYRHVSNVNEQTNALWAEHREEEEGPEAGDKREVLLDIHVGEQAKAIKTAARCLEIIDPDAPPRVVKAMTGSVFLQLSAIYENAGGKHKIPSNLDEVEDKFCQLLEQQRKSSRTAELAYQRRTAFMSWIRAETKLFKHRKEERVLRRVPPPEKPPQDIGGTAYGEFAKEGQEAMKQVYPKQPLPKPDKSKEELEMEMKRKQGFKSFYDGWDIEGERSQGGEEC